jgi:hypothetical protein
LTDGSNFDIVDPALLTVRRNASNAEKAERMARSS